MGNPIVSTAWVAERLHDDSVCVVEVFSTREDAQAATVRVPGAVRFYWKDLCWHPTNREFVTPDELAQRLGPVGISHEHTVVLFGDPVQFGTYAYWSLLMAGHADTRIVDGARAKWLAEARPTRLDVTAREAREYVPGTPATAMRVGRDDVRAHLGRPQRLLLDVRSPEEYSGERVMAYGSFDHGAERGGRIPGAKHFYFGHFLNEDDTFRTADEITAALRQAGIDVHAYDEIVCYCRLSHRASLAWTALTHIVGLDTVRIYDGSWTEWGSIVGVPIENPLVAPR